MSYYVGPGRVKAAKTIYVTAHIKNPLPHTRNQERGRISQYLRPKQLGPNSRRSKNSRSVAIAVGALGQGVSDGSMALAGNYSEASNTSISEGQQWQSANHHSLDNTKINDDDGSSDDDEYSTGSFEMFRKSYHPLYIEYQETRGTQETCLNVAPIC